MPGIDRPHGTARPSRVVEASSIIAIARFRMVGICRIRGYILARKFPCGYLRMAVSASDPRAARWARLPLVALLAVDRPRRARAQSSSAGHRRPARSLSDARLLAARLHRLAPVPLRAGRRPVGDDARLGARAHRRLRRSLPHRRARLLLARRHRRRHLLGARRRRRAAARPLLPPAHELRLLGAAHHLQHHRRAHARPRAPRRAHPVSADRAALRRAPDAPHVAGARADLDAARARSHRAGDARRRRRRRRALLRLAPPRRAPRPRPGRALRRADRGAGAARLGDGGARRRVRLRHRAADGAVGARHLPARARRLRLHRHDAAVVDGRRAPARLGPAPLRHRRPRSAGALPDHAGGAGPARRRRVGRARRRRRR